jgi:hypothetical protein
VWAYKNLRVRANSIQHSPAPGWIMPKTTGNSIAVVSAKTGQGEFDFTKK